MAAAAAASPRAELGRLGAAVPRLEAELVALELSREADSRRGESFLPGVAESFLPPPALSRFMADAASFDPEASAFGVISFVAPTTGISRRCDCDPLEATSRLITASGAAVLVRRALSLPSRLVDGAAAASWSAAG